MTPTHHLNASAPNGRFRNTGDQPSSPAQVDALMDYLQKQQIKKLTLHFHGGLVNERRGMETAQRMAENYVGTSHSLGVLWDTGFMTTLLQRFEHIEKTELFKKLRDIVLRKVLEKLGVEAGARGPAPKSDEAIEAETKTEQPFESFDEQARENAESWDEFKLEVNRDAIEAELELEIDEEHPLVEAVQVEGPEEEFYKKEHLIPVDAHGPRALMRRTC